jgi:hypothetical protein
MNFLDGTSRRWWQIEVAIAHRIVSQPFTLRRRQLGHRWHPPEHIELEPNGDNRTRSADRSLGGVSYAYVAPTTAKR